MGIISALLGVSWEPSGLLWGALGGILGASREPRYHRGAHIGSILGSSGASSSSLDRFPPSETPPELPDLVFGALWELFLFFLGLSTHFCLRFNTEFLKFNVYCPNAFFGYQPRNLLASQPLNLSQPLSLFGPPSPLASSPLSFLASELVSLIASLSLLPS